MILATFADHAKLTALHPLFAQGVTLFARFPFRFFFLCF